MKSIVFYRADGSVRRIRVPAPNARRRILVSEAEYRDEVDTEQRPTGLVDGQGNPVMRTVETARRKMLVKDAVYRDETDAEMMARLKADNVPADAAETEEVDPATLPGDRAFREAWAKINGRVDVDMPKARTIHMDRIRKARDAKLQSLDGEEMAAQSSGDTSRLTQVRAQKQALRDLPQTLNLDAAWTPEELKAIWPEDID